MNPKLTRLTAEMLVSKGACADQVSAFRRLWPRGVVPSRAAIQRAEKASLDLDWYAKHFLSASARATYEAARTSAWAIYGAAIASALATYKAATASAWATYEAARAPALATFDAARAPAWATHRASKANALADALGF